MLWAAQMIDNHDDDGWNNKPADNSKFEQI